jgi:serine protease AprX
MMNHSKFDQKLKSVYLEKESLQKTANQNSSIPVLVKLKSNSRISSLSEVCPLTKGDREKGKLLSLNYITGQFCLETLQELSRNNEVEKIYFDQGVKALLNVATPAVGATGARNMYGVTGKGLSIAILDTGIYPHPDLTNPTNRIVAFRDFIEGRTAPYDDNGHGTHVAGCAAANGYSSGGVYRAPAPEANLVGVKVLDGQGGGSFSTVISGIDYCIQNKQTYNIRIINLSLGATPTVSYTDCPLAQACEEAWNAGILVLAAAGNTGPTGTINTPGFDPLILTAGAINDRNSIDRTDDTIAAYTSRRPTINGFIKPDIAVPGSNITSLLAPNSTLANELPGNIVGSQYFTLSGTSMATGIASGISAQLISGFPRLDPNRVKALLLGTSTYFAPNYAGYSIITRTFQLLIQ